MPAEQFLAITYPTTDLIGMLRAAAPGQSRPIALMGECGLGKSHLLGALYYALTDQAATKTWLAHWAGILGEPSLEKLPLRSGLEVLSASLHQQRYPFLWDVLFNHHSEGKVYRGIWEHAGPSKTPVPSTDILLGMFEKHPTALILDEFQTWFDGLVDAPNKPHKTWAFNFIPQPPGVDFTEITADNNASERDLRPTATYRKVTGGFRSDWGADLFAAVRSVIGTAKRRGIDAYQAIHETLRGQSVVAPG